MLEDLRQAALGLAEDPGRRISDFSKALHRYPPGSARGASFEMGQFIVLGGDRIPPLPRIEESVGRSLGTGLPPDGDSAPS